MSQETQDRLRQRARELQNELNIRLDMGEVTEMRTALIASQLMVVDDGFSPTTGQPLTQIVAKGEDGSPRMVPSHATGQPEFFPLPRLLEELAVRHPGLLK